MRGNVVEVVVVLIGPIRWQRVVLNRIVAEPSQGGVLRRLRCSDALDLYNQGFIRREIERLIGG